MSDFTEQNAITAVRMIADGATWLEVVDELYPDAECCELLANLTQARTRYWYKRQTPERLMEVLA